MTNYVDLLEESFSHTTSQLFSELKGEEQLTVNLKGECTTFTRFNNGSIRQSGEVKDATLSLWLVENEKKSAALVPFTGDLQTDLARAQGALGDLREEVAHVPDDPFIVSPAEGPSSYRKLVEDAVLGQEKVAHLAASTNITGLFASGPQVAAFANSKGVKHLFANESYFLEYSLFHSSGKAIKATIAGKEFVEEDFSRSVHSSLDRLKALDRPIQRIPPGRYRVYMEPTAVADLVSMLNWNGVSERSMRLKASALLKMREEGVRLSPLMTLRENFTLGQVPQFNELGELGQEVTIFNGGCLHETLVSQKSAKEYGISANGASFGEYMRSPELLAGDLEQSEVLSRLGDGIYISNIHYTNWSDARNARVTGMTRYAPFLVKGGELVAPIEDMRFDDTLFSILGEKLEALSAKVEFVPFTSTYGSRSFGGYLVPGALIGELTLTL